MNNIKDKIIKIAKNMNIDSIGFTSAGNFEDIRPYIKERAERGFLSGFEEGDIEKRLDPLKTFDKAQSIISIAMSYNYKWDKPPLKDLYGEISKGVLGKDYHRVLYEKMEALMEVIRNEIMPVEYLAFVDTGPLSDRAIAYRAGIGRYGKNGFIISPEYGSWIFLGHILVDRIIEEDKPLEGDICGSCDLCIKACPTGALEGPYLFNAKKCISYLTQKRDLLSYEEQRQMGNHIYGCDICQGACPQNNNVKHTDNNFRPQLHLASPKLKDVLKMTNWEFKEYFKPTAAGWRGKKILQRNAIIALGNSKNDKALPLLEDGLGDIRWEIRFYTIDALEQLGEPGKEIIKKWINREEDPRVKQKMEDALS